MLFDKKKLPHAAAPANVQEANNLAFLSHGYREFRAQLPTLTNESAYHFLSFGRWSLRDVVFRVLTLTGPAKLAATSYGLGPDTATALVKAKQTGIITDGLFIYDEKIEQHKPHIHQLMASNFKVKTIPMHAKITCIINDEWGVMISGSANWSDKTDKIELTTIWADMQLATYFFDALSRIAYSDAKSVIQLKNVFDTLTGTA